VENLSDLHHEIDRGQFDWLHICHAARIMYRGRLPESRGEGPVIRR
jgi:hypothetical protein